MCVNSRHLGPGARGKAARNGGARGGGSTELAALKRYVFQDSMRYPLRGSSLGHFSQKPSSHSRGVEKFLHFATPLELGPPFWPEMPPVRVPFVFFDLSEKIDFRSGGVVKIAPLICSRVLRTKITFQKCIISRVGDTFSERKGNSRLICLLFLTDMNSLENFQGLDTTRRSALEEFVG